MVSDCELVDACFDVEPASNADASWRIAQGLRTAARMSQDKSRCAFAFRANCHSQCVAFGNSAKQC